MFEEKATLELKDIHYYIGLLMYQANQHPKTKYVVILTDGNTFPYGPEQIKEYFGGAPKNLRIKIIPG